MPYADRPFPLYRYHRKHHARLSCCLAALLCTAAPAWADIYKHIDEHGHITYTNLPRQGARALFPQPGKALPTGKPTPATKAASPSASAASFPKVERATQRQRDDLRRQILQDELKAEEGLLAGARVANNADAQRRHARNIELLKKELGALK